ncbi:MAG TPA: SGNH/GDSL hydrolase family protein [Mycobacteriales bacterium]|nr:SGNH/GDSL hydrolase family protein [Mycobacteriales bacterium]
MAASPTPTRIVRGLCVVAVAGTIAGLAASPALGHSRSTASVKPVVAGSRYLALGDSVVFGYRESNSIPAPKSYANAKKFVGFPEDVAANLGLKLTNAACPGETTASFLNTKAQSNGCENTFDKNASGPVPGGYRTAYPLHAKYKSSSQSQLAFAEAYLKAHPNTRLVTLMIGANDGFICLAETSDSCINEIGTVTSTITKNATKIFKGIRDTAHYTGQLVVVSYYSTDYSQALDNLESQEVTNAVTAAGKGYHVTVADGYGQFEKAAKQAGGDTCAAQLLTALSGADAGTCGVHPSVAGQALLAQAVEQAIKK